MKVIIVFLFIIGLSFHSETQAQCLVTASSSATTVCAGDPVQLYSSGGCGVLMNNDFNNGTIGAGWSSNASPMFNNPCGAGLPGSGIHCWIGSATNFPRELVTIPFNLINGCSISFEMRYASDENATDCEDPDEATEGVHLQYSLPPYSSWVDINYWTPNSSYTGPLYTWNSYTENIPPAAFSTATKIRWYQDLTSGNTWDHWGIDEVEITCPMNTGVVWSHGPTVFDPPTVYPTSDTTYIVTVFDTVNGYSASDSVFINVNQIPTSDFSVVSPICSDGTTTVTYQGNASAGANYNWLLSGATVISGSGAGPYTLSWPFSGTMYLSLEVTDSGCTSPVTYDSVLVNQAPVASFSADDQNGCAPHTVQFTDMSNPAGSIWQWSFGDNTTSTAQNPSHTYTTDGLYDVSLVVITPQGCDDTLSYSNFIEVYEQPIAQISADPLITSIVDPSFVFSSSSTGVSDWLWSFGDGFTSTDVPDVSHSYLTDGVFNVVLIVTSADGCADTAQISVQVIAEPAFFNVITPDGNGLNDFFVIENAERIDNSIVVFNRWGKKVFEATNYDNTWDGGDLADGTYYYIFIYGVEMEKEYQGTLTILRQ